MARFYRGFAPYHSVSQRREKASAAAKSLTKNQVLLYPVQPLGTAIAKSFWGKAWCKNLESYSDYANRLPRGRSYLRNGAVLTLEIQPGVIDALVSGSSIYTIRIRIKPLLPERWNALCKKSAGGIASLVELLQGKFSESLMSLMTERETGLFPSPSEITLGCSCPDVANMCKHVAAVLYGVGTRLDEKPELLFTLRSVDQRDLVAQAASVTAFTTPSAPNTTEVLSNAEVSALFGIEMAELPNSVPPSAASPTVPTAIPTPTKKAKSNLPQKKTKPRRKSSSKVSAHTGDFCPSEFKAAMALLRSTKNLVGKRYRKRSS